MLSNAFNALSNPHRLEIYSILSGCCLPGTECDIHAPGACNVGDIGSRLSIAPSTLSHHLKELNRSGLISMTRQGKQVFCAVDSDMHAALSRYFNSRSRRTGQEA